MPLPLTVARAFIAAQELRKARFAERAFNTVFGRKLPWKYFSRKNLYKTAAYVGGALTGATISDNMPRRTMWPNDVLRLRKKMKRMSDSNALVLDQSMRPAQTAGGFNGFTFMSARKTINLGKPQSKLAVLMKKMQVKETSVISKFQGLTKTLYADTTSPKRGHFPLCKRWTDSGSTTTMELPLYVFNLTASPHPENFGPTNNEYASFPMYRLKKTVTASGTADEPVRNYDWTTYTGLKPDGVSTTFSWLPERVNNLTSSNLLEMNGQYFHHWTTVDLSLVNVSSICPHRIHLAVVQFLNPACAPQRRFYNGNNITYDAIPNGQDICRSDLFYDKFLAKTTVHPNRSIVQMLDKNKCIKFLSYECICLDIVGTNYNTVFTKHLYIKDGKLYKCLDPQQEEKLHNPTINTGYVPNYNQMWDVPPASTGITTTSSPFPKFSDDRYLMIWTEDFNTPALYTDPRNDNTSFDLCARTKCTYSVL